MNLFLTGPVCSAGSILPARKHAQIRFAMRVSFFYFSLLLGTSQLLMGHSGNGQELHEIKISLEARNQNLISILKKIEQQTGLSFVVPLDEAESYDKINFTNNTRTIKETLDLVFRNTFLDYRQVGKRTILVFVKDKKLPGGKTDHDSYEVESPPPGQNVPIHISGRVTDEKGEALPGVSILIKGSQSGTSTDVNGNFELDVPAPETFLVFSFVGYISQEIKIGSQTKLDIVLRTDEKALEEVIVIGYGVQKKSDLTGSVGVVKGEVLNERPVASLNQALGGRIAGVNVSVNSGRPGGRANIRIRGNTSITVGNQPLYVIDGIILNVTGLANGSTPIDFIDPANIASIEVLKDASATAIYGSRGANGVILITTKNGDRKGNKLQYDGYLSVGTLSKKLDLLNSKEFLLVEEIQYQNAKKYDPIGWGQGKYTDPRLKRTNPLLFYPNGDPIYDTDWQKEATQAAVTQSHHLSFTGGNNETSYGLFLGYRNEEGVMRESWLKRYSARLALDTRINSWLSAGGSVSYNHQNENQIDPVGAGGIIPMRTVLQALPIVPVKYPDGKWGTNEDYPGMEGGTTYSNLVAEQVYLPITQTMLGNTYLTARLARNLEFRTSLGVNLINQRVNSYAGGNLKYVSRDQNGVAYIDDQRHNSWQFENQLSYNTVLADVHAFSGLLGASWQSVGRFSFRGESQGFSDDYFQFNNLGFGSNPRPSTSSSSEYNLDSYFGRLNYILKNKYLLTVTGRIDGSSKFGSDNRYSFFPSAAVGWKVSEEEFLRNSPVVSSMKLRASFGMTGNSEIPNYQSEAGLGNYSTILNGKRVIGVGIQRMANPALQWEKNMQLDAGLELGLFNDNLLIEADVYRRVSDNMLLSAPVPSSSGYTSIIKNVGSMQNSGFELTLTTYNLKGNIFSWNTNFNISFNRNKVIALTGGSDIISGSNIDGATIVREGEAVNSFFGLVSLGTWKTTEEELAAKYYLRPGDRKYQDTNNDGAINDLDRVIIGNGAPKGYGSFINNFKLKQFDFVLDLQYMFGNDVSYMTKSTTEDRQGITNVFSTVLDAWRPDNQDSPIAELRPIAAGYNRSFSSDRIYDGSFIRGRNLMISYSFPQETINRLKLGKLRVYLSAQNFFLLTKYPGYDPEVSTSAAQFAQGMDFYSYPKPKVFTMGVNVVL